MGPYRHQLGGMSAWIAGTNQGLLTALENERGGRSFFTKLNGKNIPSRILILQGVIVSVLALLFFIMPNLSSSFWILTAFATQLYILMYILMFIAAILLRYKAKNVHRAYRIPGKNWGMHTIASIGIASSIFAFAISFIPPGQIDTGNIVIYECIFALGWLSLALVFGMRNQEAKHKIADRQYIKLFNVIFEN